jgi:hypothetical protein
LARHSRTNSASSASCNDDDAEDCPSKYANLRISHRAANGYIETAAITPRRTAVAVSISAVSMCHTPQARFKDIKVGQGVLAFTCARLPERCQDPLGRAAMIKPKPRRFRR